MMNKVMMTGRLTKDVELRRTEKGKAVGNFTLAVRRNFPNQNGEYDTDFINCVVWGNQAETIEQYVKKGHMLGVTGSLRTRTYKNKLGMTVYVTEVLVDTFDFLQPKGAIL